MASNPIEQELVALTDPSGYIRPSVVVAWAREHPESALHKRLQWDDKLAAEQHRLDQVRHLIAVYVRTEDGFRSTISLIHDRTPVGGYRHLNQVMSSSDMRAIALRQALAELTRWRARYEYMRELAGIFAAADAVQARIEPAPQPVGAIAEGATATAAQARLGPEAAGA